MWIEYMLYSNVWGIHLFKCPERKLIPIGHQLPNESFWLVPGTYED